MTTETIEKPKRVLEVYRDPGVNGYGNTTRLTMTESVTPLAATTPLRIADFLPPATP